MLAADTPPAVVRPAPETPGLLPEVMRAMFGATTYCMGFADAARDRAEFDRALAGSRKAVRESPPIRGGSVVLEEAPSGTCRVVYRGPSPDRVAFALRNLLEAELKQGRCTFQSAGDEFTCRGMHGSTSAENVVELGIGVEKTVVMTLKLVSVGADAPGIRFLPSGIPDLSWP